MRKHAHHDYVIHGSAIMYILHQAEHGQISAECNTFQFRKSDNQFINEIKFLHEELFC